MQQVSIIELIQEAEKEEDNNKFCEIFANWQPKTRILLILWWESCEYPYKLMILNRGKKERKESFKHSIQQLDRAMEILKDYGISLGYPKWRDLEKIYDDSGIYEGIVLVDYKE